VSEIPEIVDFVKEKGRLQFTLSDYLPDYEGLDFLDPIFTELNPPTVTGLRFMDFMPNDRAFTVAAQTFRTFAKGRFEEILRRMTSHYYTYLSHSISNPSKETERAMEMYGEAFMFLKGIQHPLINQIENLMVDNPIEAVSLLGLAIIFIERPLYNTRCDLTNFSLGEIHWAHQDLPPEYRLRELRFPCEIGKFLFKKLTIAPSNLRSCYELLDHFHSYDLQKAIEALNDGIILNHPDIVNKTAEELSEILDAIWKDTGVCKRITGLKIGMPLLAAAAGFVAGGPIGAAGAGLLEQLGFKVADKAVSTLFDSQTTGLSERVAKKLRMRSYQINLYDFKKKYAGALLPPPSKDASA
jgi:hypothetical protein